MTPIGFLFTVVAVVAIWTVPRPWTPIPLLAGCVYMTLSQGFELGSFSFPIIRLLILAGLIRMFLRNERLENGMDRTDWLMMLWGLWAVCSSAFHKDPSEALVFRLGFIYNSLGVYFLTRIWCTDFDSVVRLVRLIGFLLLPVALEMCFEQVTGRNAFAVLGGELETVVERAGRLRSQGPFAHPILAGTVGAVCLPLLIGIWSYDRKAAFVGMAACALMVITSNSSGPLTSAFVALGGVALWRWRHLTRQMQIAALLAYGILDLVMKAPPYYLIARIDLTGGSTGWHRAHLIEQAFKHLGEWWLAGTDYTRHWMPTGVSWSPDHTDITNYYLKLGVIGGLPLMILFIYILWRGFSAVGDALCCLERHQPAERFMTWCLGAGLLAHTATSLSVSYFDQSFVFLYLKLGLLISLRQIVCVTNYQAERDYPAIQYVG